MYAPKDDVAAAASTDRGAWFWPLLNAVQALFTALWSAFWIVLALLVLITTFRRRWPLAMARRGWGPGLLWGAMARLEVTGGERLDPTQTYVFIANHGSMIDVPVVFAALPVNVRFVLKRELAWVPFIGWYAWAMGMVFVDRADRTQAVAAIQRAARRVRRGASVIAFAEGTRSRSGRIGPFKKGAVQLALAAEVPLVPVALAGTAAVLPSDGFRVRPGTIRVAIGDPIPTAGGERDELVRRVRGEVIALSASIGGPPAA